MKKLLLLLIIHINLFGQELSSTLPIIIINTNNEIILDSPRIICDMGIIYNPGKINNSTDLYNNYNGKLHHICAKIGTALCYAGFYIIIRCWLSGLFFLPF